MFPSKFRVLVVSVKMSPPSISDFNNLCLTVLVTLDRVYYSCLSFSIANFCFFDPLMLSLPPLTFVGFCHPSLGGFLVSLQIINFLLFFDVGIYDYKLLS